MKLKNTSFHETFNSLVSSTFELIVSLKLTEKIKFDYHKFEGDLVKNIIDAKDLTRSVKAFIEGEGQRIIFKMPSGAYFLVTKENLFKSYQFAINDEALSENRKNLFKDYFFRHLPMAFYFQLRDHLDYPENTPAIVRGNLTVLDKTTDRDQKTILEEQAPLEDLLPSFFKYIPNYSLDGPTRWATMGFLIALILILSVTNKDQFNKKVNIEDILPEKKDDDLAEFDDLKNIATTTIYKIINSEQKNYLNLEPVDEADLALLESTLDKIVSKMVDKIKLEPYSPHSPHLLNKESVQNFYQEIDSFYKNEISPLLKNNRQDSFCFDPENSFHQVSFSETYKFLIKQRNNNGYIKLYMDLMDSARLNFFVNLYCEKLDLNPRMVLAIMAKESHFNPMVVGKEGEYGLGQIMPANLTVYGMTKNNAFNIFLNTRATCYHLHRAFVSWKHKTDDQQLLAIASYNAGIRKIETVTLKNKKHPSLTSYAPAVIKLQKTIK